jgi:hypothetical protein
MRDHGIGLDLFTDVLDVPHWHGFARGDEHAGRPIFLISDLARICEGTQDQAARDEPSQPGLASSPMPPNGPRPTAEMEAGQ